MQKQVKNIEDQIKIINERLNKTRLSFNVILPHFVIRKTYRNGFFESSYDIFITNKINEVEVFLDGFEYGVIFDRKE